MVTILWIILVLVLIGWLAGTIINVGPLIHLLLLVALVILIVNLVTGRRAV